MGVSTEIRPDGADTYHALLGEARERALALSGLCALLLVALLASVGCGNGQEPAGKTEGAAVKPTDAAAAAAAGTTVTLGKSEFGPMLFSTGGRAVYIFERDPKGRTACHGECARAWPPVYTEGEPEAANGVRKSLLGTVKRPDGRLQVTYAGQPLYFYAHERPGEVRCHNVDLNGGLWWVVGPDGTRRP
jgi:predicted lipoprotein with Yx(FWY)xxD motif